MAIFEWKQGIRQFIEVAGKSLECACIGPSPKTSPTIVLLHEGLGCVDLWRDFPEHLSERTGWGVFTFSRLGYGNSDSADLPRPLDYMSREAVDVLPAVLEKIGFQKGILAGHSDGATIAAIYGGTVIDHRIRGLVLMAPHFFTEQLGLREIANAKRAYETADLRERLAKYHRDPDNAFRGWNDAWLDPRFEEWDVSDVIDYIRVPVMAIQGEDDQYGSLAQLNIIEERCYAPVELSVLKKCRHSPHLDQPDNTVAAIADYLNRLSMIDAPEIRVGSS